MNQEHRLQNKLDNPDLLVIAGSRLYGTNTPESDNDFRGFITPPFEYLAGLSNFQHQVIREPDTIIYSIKRFFQLLMTGDPTAYEILFAPESSIMECSDIGEVILHNRSLFACKRFARRIGGYAQSEWRKVTGTQLVPIKRTPNEDQIIEDIRKAFHPPKEEMDEIIRLLFLQHPREVRSARQKLGAKQKAQIEQYGFCTSSACHTIRLLGQLIELMETGSLTFPRPNVCQLLSIKQGKLSLEMVTKIYDTLRARANIAENSTNLPNNAPVKQIQTLYHEIVAHILTTDEQAHEYNKSYIHHWE